MTAYHGVEVDMEMIGEGDLTVVEMMMAKIASVEMSDYDQIGLEMIATGDEQKGVKTGEDTERAILVETSDDDRIVIEIGEAGNVEGRVDMRTLENEKV
mmetsp:Transcript_19436/g.29023  ORF Transcript_19436/g.29023 Transcript_19436/m.29023 type:complete len:99 (+) Transcript_19436:464-760(+)